MPYNRIPSLDPTPPVKKILCIDIGGTRIKSAVLPENPTLSDVQNAPRTVIRTLGWLNQSLPRLLDPGHWSSLAAHYQNQKIRYDAVALSVPGEIGHDGGFKRSDLIHGPAKVPEHLLEAFKKTAGCPVSVIKDADAWMMGFQCYASQVGVLCEYPAVLMAFGTGLGISAATSADTVLSIEAGARPADSWGRLSSAAGRSIYEGWHVHGIIGCRFFDFVEESRKDWDHLVIREEYTKRVQAALLDILPWIESKIGRIRTVAIAGGNAEYVSVRGLSEGGLNVVSLTDRLCAVSPDLITVLGVEASSRKPMPETLQ